MNLRQGDVLVLTTTLLLVAIQPSLQWPVNDYDEEFTFTCPNRQFLSKVASSHSNKHEDRKFDLDCRQLPINRQPSCQWTQYVNDYDQPMAFLCPNEGVISGMSSVHNNRHEDRLFKFYCCVLPATIRYSCLLTEWLNNWDNPFNFQVPDGQVMAGMTSYHDNNYEDRRFKLNICRLRN